MADPLNCTSFEQQSRKRKRKTSDEQYELYLEEMEGDYDFCSGIINPTLGKHYLNNKWSALTEQLNCSGNGPQLPVEEWKRRFKDWKNSTRAKYRKIKESMNRTGGPKSTIKLTPLEERGLSVWGRVTVSGFVGVKEGELPKTVDKIPANNTQDSINIDPDAIAMNCCGEVEHLFEESDDNTDNINLIKRAKHKTRKIQKRSPPLNDLASHLIDACNSSAKTNQNIVSAIEQFTATYKEIEVEKIKIKHRQLDFVIQKYKFENPNFYLNENQ